MSSFGEEIINRINSNSGLTNPNNPAYNVINNTIGEWLDHFDLLSLYDGVFLQSAKGGYLNLFGHDYNILRELDEDDEHYRKRIIYETLGHLTVNYLVDIYNLILYVYVEDFDASDNMLTSDNPYLSEYGFMAVADDDVKNILNKKFVIGSGLTWLTL